MSQQTDNENDLKTISQDHLCDIRCLNTYIVGTTWLISMLCYRFSEFDEKSQRESCRIQLFCFNYPMIGNKKSLSGPTVGRDHQVISK